jgi:anti-sigma factor RsiW
MSAKHPIEVEELMAYLDGELAAERASDVVYHREECASCEDLSADFRIVSQRLMAWEVEMADAQIPSRIVTALEEKFEKSGTRKIDATPPLKTKFRRWVWAGAFGVVCLFLGLGARVITLYRTVGSPMTDARDTQPRPTASMAPRFSMVPNARPMEQTAESFSVDDKQEARKKQLESAISASLEVSGGANPLTTGPMVVRTAGITITVKDLDKARAALDDILRRHDGYIAELNLNTPSGASRNFTSTLRVPASGLDATIAELRNFGRVESESQSGEEVTEQYVDLQARLSNAHNTEQRLTDLLRQRTGKLSDVLAVETELDRVRGEIERMEAEKKNLANKVDFATINATVSEDYRAQLEVVPSTTWGQIRNAGVEGYRTMSESVIAAVLFLFSYGPSILFWGVVLFFPARYTWKRRRQIFNR